MPIDFQAILKEWGLTLELLAVGACAFLVLLTLSVREFMGWFMRMNRVLKNQTLIIQKLQTIDQKLQSLDEKVICVENNFSQILNEAEPKPQTTSSNPKRSSVLFPLETEAHPSAPQKTTSSATTHTSSVHNTISSN